MAVIASLVAFFVLFGFLVEAGQSGRTYPTVRIKDLSTNVHTHVCVTGNVAYAKRQPDGDLHVRLEASDGSFVIVEEIPAIPVVYPIPKVGATGTACGITRYDRKHKWEEIHPVERWKERK